MKNEQFLRNLSLLGFPLLEPDKEVDVNTTIHQVLKNEDMRFIEGFPAILANAARHPSFDIDVILNLCKNEKEKRRFMHLIILSMSLYKYFHLKFWWTNELYNKMTDNDKKTINKFSKYLKKEANFTFMDYTLNPSHIRNVFENYFQSEESRVKNVKSNYEELSLEFALSQIFTPKQKALFIKKLNGEKMTKTEREYYSRLVKKKVIALANTELHGLSKKLLGY
ncbi:MAG: hypothetical protein KAU58_06020 [Candidatus Omnitrophica bacterium]|nr:hypothetical protein [Candidatus Omnitrophota bacterium]